MGIFDRREQFKPYEYPVAIDLMDKLQKTYWLHTEIPFSADPQEIKNLPYHEQEIVIRSLLAISTVEVAVKTFWTQLGNHFPIPEWEMLGVVAGESEVRHARSYAHLLSLLDLEDRFSIIKEVECIKGRFEYLDKYLRLDPKNTDRKQYIIKLILFSVLIEHTSLFSQFATVLYFYRNRGLIKDVRNVIKWTAIEEELHFRIGSTIINILRQEYPELFDEDLNKKVRDACLKSVHYEQDILDWIFEEGELSDLTKADLSDFMKDKVNSSMRDMGFDGVFDQSTLNLTNTRFFNEEIFADSMDDFFAVRPTDYTLKDVSITAEDLF